MLLRRVLLSRAGVALVAASAVGIGASTVVIRTELAPFTPGVRSVVLPGHGPPRAIVGPEIGPLAPVHLAGRVSAVVPAPDARHGGLAVTLRPRIGPLVTPALSAVAAVAKPVVSSVPTAAASPTAAAIKPSTNPQYAAAAGRKPSRAAPKPTPNGNRDGKDHDVGRVAGRAQHGKRG